MEDPYYAEIKTRFVTIEGQKLHVGIRPAQTPGTPLLIFNGIGANLELVEPLMHELPDIETIIFDIPGTGGSPAPKGPYRFMHMAELASLLLEKLGYRKAHIMGVSWGGALAQEFAINHPDHTDKLILAATSSGMPLIPSDPVALMRLATPVRYTRPDYFRENVGALYGGDFRAGTPKTAEHLARMRSPKKIGYMYQQLATIAWTSLPWLHKIKSPTLILSGDDDPLVHTLNGDILRWFIPNARHKVLNCGHLFVVTRPKQVAELIEDFLAETT